MDLSRYVTFSSFEHAGGVERRLARHYAPHFDELLGMTRMAVPPLCGQQVVTEELRETIESVVLAVRWHVLPGLDVVLLLLDDDEFGRDIKWLFAEVVRDRVDLKFLVVLVEQSMEILLACLEEPGVGEGLADGQRRLVDGPAGAAVVVRSSLFCWSFPTDGIVPEGLRMAATGLAGAVGEDVASLAVRDAWMEDEVRGRGMEPVLCFDVITGMRACLATSGGRLEILVDRPDIVAGRIGLAALSLARVQTQVISVMVGSSG